ncbi:aminoacyl-tRNA hydrolase [Chryseobacterium manosquense]|uniref:Aminoacyl-tRNA hydrolase n=1 Tax=Chryseobacterium manosquense TaxID=2754694 RepID=A0A7H1DVY4_9FLAO|nr:alternative ribosome rescue aminoacyl-tRNA hydrolase ArfB [Chryseobacterium manosquense]QNS41142.1 aminoacyl-tRNA hydrolase [Chryseobacterium manosquense]
MRNFTKELTYKTSRSSGAGGQNVNKVETSVTVQWKVADTEFFSNEEIELISEKLKNRINLDGILQLTVSESRTQLQNKKIATEKILELVEKSLIKPKPRKATKPSKRQIEKRITAKKQISEKKENRRFRF